MKPYPINYPPKMKPKPEEPQEPISIDTKEAVCNLIAFKIKTHAVLMNEDMKQLEQALHENHQAKAEYWRGCYNAHSTAINLLDALKAEVKRL